VVTVLRADDRMQRNARPDSACADASSHPQFHSYGSASIVVSEGFDTYEYILVLYWIRCARAEACPPGSTRAGPEHERIQYSIILHGECINTT
jgi:hypothetical protein